MTAEFWVGPAGAPDTFGLVSLLGGGGEGEVWKAVLPLSQGGRRTAAVKIMEAIGYDGELERWERFGHLLRSLAHPGLVRVTDVFSGPGMHRPGTAGVGSFLYVVMDHVDGVPLHEWAAENPETTVSQRLRMLRTTAAALDAMHSGATTEVPVAHGDVKPANIVVTAERSAVLVDLGLARLTDATGVCGHSAPYAAPELRTSGALATPAADRYAFAVTVAHALTATPPPLGPDGWLDVDALDALLRQHPATAKRHVLVQRLMAVVTATPDARPSKLREWLDGTVESLSQITGPGPSGETWTAPATTTTVPTPAAGSAGSPTYVPAGADVPPPGGYAHPPAAVPVAGTAAPDAPRSPRRGRRRGIVLALAALLTLAGVGTAVALLGQAGDTAAAAPAPGSTAVGAGTPGAPDAAAQDGVTSVGLKSVDSPSGGSGGHEGGGSPGPTRCSFDDAGNGKPIAADRGSRFTDSLGNTYRVDDGCRLTLVGSRPTPCSFADAGNGRPITADRGSRFTDSLGNTYRVSNSCTLTLIGSTPRSCSFSDAGNGKPIAADRGSRFTDSLGNTYRVDDGCTLSLIRSATCSFSDAGNGDPIVAEKGSTFTDSLGSTYRVGNGCTLTRT